MNGVINISKNNKPKDLKDIVLSWIDDEEITTLPLEDLYSLLETRCRLYNNDYVKGCEIIDKRRVELCMPQTKEEKLAKRRNWENNYYQTWRKENDKRYEFRFKKIADADVIEWLDSQPNRSEYIKNLIRADKEKAR